MRLGEAREQLGVVSLRVVIVRQSIEENIVDEVLRSSCHSDGGIDSSRIPNSLKNLLGL
jgi:hypothetical protein